MKTTTTKRPYNKKTVQKFLELIKPGLTKGKGNGSGQPGTYCIEVALNIALGGSSISDNPPCVGEEVRNYKIGLNDCSWESDLIRAQTMAPIGIAQLGSDTLDQKEFKRLIFKHTQTDIVTISFDWIPDEKRIPEHKELQEFIRTEFDIEKLNQKFYPYNNYYYYNYYYYYYHYYNNYNNNYYYKFYYNNYYLQKVLKLSVDVCLKVLKEMKSPGCKYLYLLDQPKH